MPRILLVNPNSTSEITEVAAEQVRLIAGDRATIATSTARFGARYISSRAAAAIAGHAALDCVARDAGGCDAVYLACFGDPGLKALQEVSPIPVVGMADAACRVAAERYGRFGIVTGGALWEPMLNEFITSIGLSANLTGVRTIAPTGGDIARNPDAAIRSLAAACETCVREDEAKTVILGGIALGGLAAKVQPFVSAPVLCSLATAAEMALDAAQRQIKVARPADWPAVGTLGLSPELARLLNPP